MSLFYKKLYRSFVIHNESVDELDLCGIKIWVWIHGPNRVFDTTTEEGYFFTRYAIK